MKVAELPLEMIEKIKKYRGDRIIEKHEGPENWDSVNFLLYLTKVTTNTNLGMIYG